MLLTIVCVLLHAASTGPPPTGLARWRRRRWWWTIEMISWWSVAALVFGTPGLDPLCSEQVTALEAAGRRSGTLDQIMRWGGSKAAAL